MTLVPEGYKFTHEAQRAACNAISKSGSRIAGAEAAGVSLTTLERRYRNDPVFREAMIEAKASFVRTLEKAAIERATEGISQEVPGPGGVFYTKIVHSDALLIHMLKKMCPETHGDKQIIQVDDKQSLGIESLTPEARGQIRQILLDQMKRAEVLEEAPSDQVDLGHEPETDMC